MLRRGWAAMAACALSTFAATLSADDPKDPSPGEPIDLTADRLELDVEAKTAVLTGHVKLARGPGKGAPPTFTLGCSRLDVRYDQVPHVTWAKGTGGVTAEVKGVRAEAPEVELDLAARTLELRGGVKLTRGEGFLTAERANIHLGTGKVTLSEVKGSIPLPKPAP